jgi:hypothetical protein
VSGINEIKTRLLLAEQLLRASDAHLDTFSAASLEDVLQVVCAWHAVLLSLFDLPGLPGATLRAIAEIIFDRAQLRAERGNDDSAN